MSIDDRRRAIQQALYRVVKGNRHARRVADVLFRTREAALLAFARYRGLTVEAPRTIADRDQLAFIAVEPAESVERRRPICLPEDEHPRFERERVETLASSGVTVLPGGRIWSAGTAILSADGELVGPLAFELDPKLERYVHAPTSHPVLQRSDLPPVQHLPGRVAALSVPGGAGYYHWLVDMLPRLHLLEQAGYPLDSIDTFVVNLATAEFQLETLAQFGIAPDRLMTSSPTSHFQADELLAPDLPGEFGLTPSWVVEFLQRRVAATAVEGASGRVYVSRRRAAHRQLLNSDAIESVVANHGFDIVELERLSFREQRELLSSTAVLCGTHGAGLTNIALCPPGSTTVSIMSPRDPSHVYWTLTDQGGGVFAYVFGPGQVLDEPELDRIRFGSEDMVADGQKLDRLLDLALMSDSQPPSA